MAEAPPTYTATVWGIQQTVVLLCFRAEVDEAGHIIRTSLGDREDWADVPDRHQEVCDRLRQRYGADLVLQVTVDGGAGFRRFQGERAGQPPRSAPPPPRPPAAQPRMFP